MTASVKIRTSWTDDNVIIEGVRIYKKQQAFDASTRPQPLVEITDSSLFYEDFDVVENQTYFYMLSCFLGEQEVFTECYSVVAEKASNAELSFIDIRRTEQVAGNQLQANIPPHLANDIIVVVVQSWDDDVFIDGFDLGFSYSNPTPSTNPMKTFVFHKIANADSTSDTTIPTSGYYGSSCSLVLRPSKKITKVSVIGKGLTTTVGGSSTTKRANSPSLTLSLEGETGFDLTILRNGQYFSTGVTNVTHPGTKTVRGTQIHPSTIGAYFNMAVFGDGKIKATNLAAYNADFYGLPGGYAYDMQGVTTFISAK